MEKSQGNGKARKYQDKFNEFKKTHGKSYKNNDEEDLRYQKFE